MTTFHDGPAQGQTLLLKRSPCFLRVVQDGTKWDALDQPGDLVAAGERVFVYVAREVRGTAHIHARGGRGGFYGCVDYQLCAEQPTEEEACSSVQWPAWCAAHRHLLIVQPDVL